MTKGIDGQELPETISDAKAYVLWDLLNILEAREQNSAANGLVKMVADKSQVSATTVRKTINLGISAGLVKRRYILFNMSRYDYWIKEKGRKFIRVSELHSPMFAWKTIVVEGSV